MQGLRFDDPGGVTNQLEQEIEDQKIRLPASVQFNDAVTPQGSSYDGMCAGFSGIHGNISVNPEFVTTNNFRLKDGSPVIDAGSNSVPDCLARTSQVIRESSMATAVLRQL